MKIDKSKTAHDYPSAVGQLGPLHTLGVQVVKRPYARATTVPLRQNKKKPWGLRGCIVSVRGELFECFGGFFSYIKSGR